MLEFEVLALIYDFKIKQKIMELQYFPQIIDTLSMTFVAKQK